MPDGTNNSELWLLRTYFGDDDDIAWITLAEQARRARSSVPGAELVISSDRTQCQQRIRRVLLRLAARSIDPDHRPVIKVVPAQNDSERAVADFTESVGDAIRASLRWRTEMTRDGSCG